MLKTSFRRILLDWSNAWQLFLVRIFTHKNPVFLFLLNFLWLPRGPGGSQDRTLVGSLPARMSRASSATGETTRSVSPGVNTRSVARLVGVAFLATSALVHLPHYHPTQVPPGKQAATNHCLPDASAPPTPRKTRLHLGEDI